MATAFSAPITRRGFLAGMGGAGLALGLTACSTGSGGGAGSKTMKFWNMPWGGPQFQPLDQKITLAYKPASGLPKVTYQAIQWASFTQTFATALASKTGPAVSSGGGAQAFQFSKEGAIAYADDLLDSWKSNGIYDDFLPGTLDAMKTPAGYVAVPYALDMRVFWYNKDLLEKAGADVPTDWQTALDACAKLKRIGVYGFAANANVSTGFAHQMILGYMINNGGGYYNVDQELDVVTDANIEALDYIAENVSKGYMDPGAISYSPTNSNSQWKAQKFGMGIDVPGLAANVGGDVASKLIVADPLVSPSGKKGALTFTNNIMMYTNTPSQKGSEAFLTYYYKNMAPLWTQKTGIGLPVLKSITETAEFRSDPNQVKIIEAWQPIAKTLAAPGGTALFPTVTQIDGTTAVTAFAQNVLNGMASKKALETLQAAVKKGS